MNLPSRFKCFLQAPHRAPATLGWLLSGPDSLLYSWQGPTLPSCKFLLLLSSISWIPTCLPSGFLPFSFFSLPPLLNYLKWIYLRGKERPTTDCGLWQSPPPTLNPCNGARRQDRNPTLGISSAGSISSKLVQKQSSPKLKPDTGLSEEGVPSGDLTCYTTTPVLSPSSANTHDTGTWKPALLGSWW